MNVYRLSTKNMEGFSIFLDSCIENGINYGTFTLANGDSDWSESITAELQTDAPIDDLEKLVRDQWEKREIPLHLSDPIHKNVDNELKKAKSIAPDDEIADQLKKVEAELGSFHGGLLALFTVDEKMYDIEAYNFSLGFERALDWADGFMYTMIKQREMSEISGSLSNLFEEMMEAHDEYKSEMHEAGCLSRHAELVEEAFEEDFNERLCDFREKYSDLAEEFIQKLDAFIGENTIFRMDEKVPV